MNPDFTFSYNLIITNIVSISGDCLCMYAKYEKYCGNSAKKDLLENKGSVHFDDILSSEMEDGYWNILDDSKKYDVFFHTEKSSDVLYVFLNGSRNPGESPVFKRWSFYTLLNASMINIDDIMYQEYSNLWLAWYYGNKTEDYCDNVVKVVKCFQKKLNAKKIVYIGSSGGGNAAIRCAGKHEDSLCVVINPQIILEKYHSGKSFQKITGNNFSEDVFNRNDTTKNVFIDNNSKYIFIENITSDDDLIQLDYLLEKCGVKDCKYGLSKIKDNCMLWTYDAPHGVSHNNQDYYEIFKVIVRITNLVLSGKSFDEVIETENDIISIISDIWHERYERVFDFQKNKRIVKVLKNDACNVSKMKKIYEVDNIFNDVSSNNIYNHFAIDLSLEPNTLYSFVFTDVDYTNYPEGIDFILKDEFLDKVSFSKRLSAGNEKIDFFTRDDVSKLKCRIYNGIPGTCNEFPLNINKMEVYRNIY